MHVILRILSSEQRRHVDRQRSPISSSGTRKNPKERDRNIQIQDTDGAGEHLSRKKLLKRARDMMNNVNMQAKLTERLDKKYAEQTHTQKSQDKWR